jgi:hypothetical protein
MNAIATTSAELTVSQQGQVLVAASLSAFGNLSANATKVIPINSDVTANGTLAAAVTKVINIDSTLNANATLVSNALVSKTLSSTLNASATTSADVDVVTQGSVSVDASLNALGTVEAEIKRTVTLESSSTTSATTELNATLTKVIEASVSATANTQSTAQLTIPVNAAANATANTSADATLSYTVNAELNATAQTTVDAQITRIISAEMTATAQTSVEAGIGVTFVSSLMASGSVTDASLLRTATLAASVTGAATVTGATLDVLDSDVAAFFARVTTAGGTLTSTEQNAVNTLVLSLKANGTWTKMKAIYPMVGSSAAACAQNLKSSSFTATFTGCTFASTGVTPNGTSGFINTALNGTNLLNNNNHQSIYSRSNVNGAGFQIGASNVGFGIITGFRIRNAGNFNGFSQMLNDSPLLIAANATSQGLAIQSRTSANISKCFMNTTLLGNLTDTSTGNITSLVNSFYLGALNISGSASQFSTNQIAFASIGDGLTDTNASDFYTSVQAFQTTLSRQV